MAVRLQTSRSQLYTKALAEFVARHDDARVQAAMNATVDEVGPPFLFANRIRRGTNVLGVNGFDDSVCNVYTY